jgi:hypothetical protein
MRPRLITTICLVLFTLGSGQAEPTADHRSNRQMAVTVCNDYRETNRLPCFVSRKECPRGFEVIESFSDSPGPSFAACRDKRHERPPGLHRPVGSQYNAKNQQLLQQLNLLVKEIEKHRIGASAPLPKATREKLAVFFSGLDLNAIELGYSKALLNGCFTDCRQIFCSEDERVDTWTDPRAPVLSMKLLHQLAHAERCEIQGGRDHFFLTWLRHLPDDVVTALEHGDPIDTDSIHFAMYMESHANNRAESICRRLRCQKD